MNKTAAILTATVVSLLVGMLLGYAAYSATSTDDCYSDAVGLAETAVTTTEDFGRYTVDSLDRILAGYPASRVELDRISSAHESNTDTLAEIQDRCGAP